MLPEKLRVIVGLARLTELQQIVGGDRVPHFLPASFERQRVEFHAEIFKAVHLQDLVIGPRRTVKVQRLAEAVHGGHDRLFIVTQRKVAADCNVDVVPGATRAFQARSDVGQHDLPHIAVRHDPAMRQHPVSHLPRHAAHAVVLTNGRNG